MQLGSCTRSIPQSDDLYIYVGRDSWTMSLLTRVAPRRATHLIYRQMKDLLS
ncbi:MAG: hypothetical protein WEE53_14205 [Acidimicrobiia bacterium]